MILVPPTGTPIAVVDRLKKLMVSIGFTNVQITTPEEHDRMIAFTSQLAHVVSSAYIKSPTAANHNGFSAGSYKDLTRVAKLNEGMWTELFLENPDNLADEIDAIIKNLQDYSDAIRGGNAETLCKLLREGRLRKEEIDNERF
jgi:prephenate dehydrogenase